MNAMDVALICKALGDANRLEIVQMLSDGEKCGCKLLERFEITQPTLSHDECSGNIVANSYLNCCICLKIKKYLMSLPHLPTSDRKSTRLNSSHNRASRMPSSA